MLYRESSSSTPPPLFIVDNLEEREFTEVLNEYVWLSQLYGMYLLIYISILGVFSLCFCGFPFLSNAIRFIKYNFYLFD